MIQNKLIIIGLLLVVQPVQAIDLKQLIALSLQSHPSIASQQLTVKSGEADVNSANWQFYPTPNLQVSTGSFSDRSVFGDFDEVKATVSLEQPLWTGGRLTGGLDKANSALNEERERLRQTQRALAFRVVQSYGDWLSASLRMKGWEESLATHFRLKSSVGRRLVEGVASKSDQLLANSRLQSVIADLAAVRAQEQVALSTLSQLVGEKMMSQQMGISLPLPSQTDNLEQMMEQALALSPDVQQALDLVDVAKADLVIQESERWPDLFFRAEHQFGTRQALQSSQSDTRPDTRVSVGLRTKFGAGLSTFSGANASRLAFQASLAAVDTQRRAINERVQGDYYLVASFGSQLPALRSAASTTEAVFNSYHRQYLAGRKTWFDLLNSARDLVQSKIQLADAEAAYLVVNWRLAILTQGLEQLMETKD